MQDTIVQFKPGLLISSPDDKTMAIHEFIK